MLENYLLKGLVIGVVFGVPAGVVGILSIQLSLIHIFRHRKDKRNPGRNDEADGAAPERKEPGICKVFHSLCGRNPAGSKDRKKAAYCGMTC